MTKLRLHTLPADAEILYAPNQAVALPVSVEHKKLIAEMKTAVGRYKGIGLAAPQIGKNLTLAIINLSDFGVEPFALINPKILSRSIKKTEMEEGCLSIPGYFAMVKRPARIEIEFWRESGHQVRLKADKLLAKVLQHEIDHLRGILIIDKSGR